MNKHIPLAAWGLVAVVLIALFTIWQFHGIITHGIILLCGMALGWHLRHRLTE